MEWLNSENFQVVFLNNRLYQWIGTAVFILFTLKSASWVYAFFKNTVQRWAEKTETKLDDIAVDVLEEPSSILIGGIGLLWGPRWFMNISSEVEIFLNYGWIFLIYLLGAWAVIGFVDGIYKEYFQDTIESKTGEFAQHFIPLIHSSINALIWVIAILLAMNSVGFDVGAFIAGLGVGGLAFALAAQSTISNLYGGITILSDQPFIKGDRVSLDGYEGVVKDVGIRSIKLTDKHGAVITIPNSTVVDSCITNASLEEVERVSLSLGLTYDTTPQQMRQAIQLLTEIIEAHPNTISNPTVLFSAFGDFALTIDCIYFIDLPEKGRSADPWEIEERKVESEINLQILEQFNNVGLEFAFPTQTLHIQKS